MHANQHRHCGSHPESDEDRSGIAIADWDAVVGAFYDLFDGLGEIAQDEVGISFNSRAPDVQTGLSLRKDGRLEASMPLHGVEVKVERLVWDDAGTWIKLVGDGVAYTYRIPSELLEHRANQR
jgi:hypothetical protein